MKTRIGLALGVLTAMLGAGVFLLNAKQAGVPPAWIVGWIALSFAVAFAVDRLVYRGKGSAEIAKLADSIYAQMKASSPAGGPRVYTGKPEHRKAYEHLIRDGLVERVGPDEYRLKIYRV